MLSIVFLFKSFYLRLCPSEYLMSLPDIKFFVRRGDEVERSLELLDRVLSEFDDLENGNVGLEDDGYMSMNGRRQFKQEFPPPPAEEAQRIISTLLPRWPKTRHRRPFGWQNGSSYRGGAACSEAAPDAGTEWRLPPRTVATVGTERHREVRRQDDHPTGGSHPMPINHQLAAVVEAAADGNFSDDSLEDVPPPPPPPSLASVGAAAVPVKRSSIAWEVPLDDDEALYTPGSTKVIGRRRRRSTDRSSMFTM
ncbi:unnamed protein product [Nesidiocoris tenuis]|uniref:Uncharacterized protein n=1 Tax=Nesidiocoris tenuis TaxID=355587 RepID=A0A6H5GQR2_9HEMI|nr:unnamed protein product [Nesidiocoris tenuis]